MSAQREKKERREGGRGRQSAEEAAEYVRHICLLCLVTLQWEDGDTHFLHLMCLLLQPMPSVNTQLLDSHFSFEASSRVERAANTRQALSVHSYGFVFILLFYLFLLLFLFFFGCFFLFFCFFRVG